MTFHQQLAIALHNKRPDLNMAFMPIYRWPHALWVVGSNSVH